MANDFRARLKRGDKLLGTMVTLPSPPAAEVLASLGFDWLFVDAEHGPLETAELLGILTAVNRRAACLVRVPSCDSISVALPPLPLPRLRKRIVELPDAL